MRIILWLIVILALGTACAGAEAPTLADGMRAISGGDYDAAVLMLYPLAEAQPQDTTLQYWLGRGYYGQTFYELAAEHLGRAVERDARNPDACLWYARALRADARPQEALEVLPIFVQRFPASNPMAFELAAACIAAGRGADALAVLNAIATRDPAPDTRATVEEWKRALAAPSPAATEPNALLKTPTFELRYAMPAGLVKPLLEAIETARTATNAAFGIEMTGFRVIAYATKSGYSAYAKAIRGSSAEPTTHAFTLRATLAVRLPEKWPEDPAAQLSLNSLLRHEMAHLAVNLRTHGQGVPLWLHEALATHGGGTAGVATGRIPEMPLTPRELNAAFASPTISRQEAAYAQAHAMAAVLVPDLGPAKLLTLLDRLAEGMPLPLAYQAVTGESLDTFLADWPKRYAALKNYPVVK